jgi:uncharacterized membrane protein required for colicin V production
MEGMTIWILALLLMALLALAGWRQGAIRAGIAFIGIVVGAFLAPLAGKIFHPLLPHFGVNNPLLTWMLAPILGFILISILFAVGAHKLHANVETFYKYKAGDLRLSLWERLNTRLGICLGIMNGVAYVVLVSFFIFNIAYLTVQVSVGEKQSAFTRLINQMGRDLESTGFSRVAAAVGTLPPAYYQVSDVAGLIMQNPPAAVRFAKYPGLVSFWEQDGFQPLVNDPVLTNAPASGLPLGEALATQSVRDFLHNKELTKQLVDTVAGNYDDLTGYITTGTSAKYSSEKIIGEWEFNPAVTLGWLRQDRPKISVAEMRAIRVLLTQAYAKTHILVAGDSKIFIKGLPKFKADGTSDATDWKGDWSRSDSGYDLHVLFNGEEKFMSAKAEDLRLTIKDGKTQLIFDRID